MGLQQLEESTEALSVAVDRMLEEARSWAIKMRELRCARAVDDPLARAIEAMVHAEEKLRRTAAVVSPPGLR